MHNGVASNAPRQQMATEHTQERRAKILHIIRGQAVADQQQLTQLLRQHGIVATQSSVSRDLRELGVAKSGDKYIIPQLEVVSPQDLFAPVARFVKEILTAGSTLTVIKTATGAAQSVALAIDRANWPEVVGTISGDDTIFIATAEVKAQRKLLERLHNVFAL